MDCACAKQQLFVLVEEVEGGYVWIGGWNLPSCKAESKATLDAMEKETSWQSTEQKEVSQSAGYEVVYPVGEAERKLQGRMASRKNQGCCCVVTSENLLQ